MIAAISEKAERIFKDNMRRFIFDKFSDEPGEKIFDVLLSDMLVDWYKRDNIKSKMKMDVVALMGESTDNPKKVAAEIVNYMVEEYIKLYSN